MRLVSRTVACMVLAALLVACSSTRERPDQRREERTLSPEQKKAIQKKVDALTREVIVKLATLGELNSLLKPGVRRVPEQRNGLQPVLYTEAPRGYSFQLAQAAALPEECDNLLSYAARKECCPNCSEATLKGPSGYPNNISGVLAFTGGVAVAAEAVAEDAGRVVDEVNADNQQK